MGDPMLAAGMMNPRIQAAIMDITANPRNISKYQNDREVMQVGAAVSCRGGRGCAEDISRALSSVLS